MSIKIDFKGLNGAIKNQQNVKQNLRQLSKYEQLKNDYDEKKKEYDEWCAKNRNAAGSVQYEDYTKKFKKWETQMLAQIQEALKKETSQTDEEVPGDLYAQLSNLLTKCSRYEFILAFLHAKNMDPNIFTTVCQALDLDNTTTPNIPMNPANIRGNNPPYLFSSPFGPSSPAPYSTPPQLPSTMPSYHMPESRSSDPMLYRPEKLPPPPRTYAENPKLPFFDISGSR